MLEFRLVPGLLGLLALATAAGCARKGSSRGAPSAVHGGVGGVLRVGNGAEPQDIDPQEVTGIPEHRIIMALFDGLLNEDPKDLHPIPGLAESWEISPDRRVYTFHLRANARWSNGDLITTDDFVESYRRMLTPAFASEYSYLLWFVAGAEDYNRGTLKDFARTGFKALDARTLQVTLKEPTPFLLKIIASHFAWDAVPVKVVAKFGRLDEKSTNWTRPGNFVGSGAYALREWRPNERIVVVRNPYYWDAAHVNLDEIDFLPTEDLTTEERMFRAGQLDITYELPNAKRDVYRREQPRVFRSDPWLGLYFFRCNVTRPPLNDKRVRRALALAINREKLVKDVTRGGERPAYAVSYPDDSGYTAKAALTGTVADARRLLAAAGYPDGRGFPTIQLLYNTNENHRAIAEAVQAMWRRNLGVNIEIQNQEWKVYLDSQHTHNFQLERAGWIADYEDPNVFLEIWKAGNTNNDTLWGSPEYDRLYAEALASPDDRRRYACYQKMDAILVDECPIIPVFYYTRVFAISPRVQGYWPTLLDDHAWKSVYFSDTP